MDILEKYEELKSNEKNLRALDIAKKLKISEAELVCARVGHGATRLTNNMQEILEKIENLGEVMALSRNPSCVHERKGIYKNPEFSKHGPMSMGLFANEDIDLRLFLDHWKFCFGVIEGDKKNTRKSIQFFDKSGTAIHKIYLTSKSNNENYETLINKLKSDQQETSILIENYPPKKADLDDNEIDWPNFRKSWENLQDTHDFYPMLRKFKVGRQQAFRNIGDDFAYRVNNNSARKILEICAKEKCEIMVFAGNRGCLQIHTGKIKNLKLMGDWYNILDPEFNLHLKEKNISEIWVTKKPTQDGIVTALEIFDIEGEIIATFFGKRKPGIPELKLWRNIINNVTAN